MIRLEYVRGDHRLVVEVNPRQVSGSDLHLALDAWRHEAEQLRHLRPNPDRPGVSITWDDPAATPAEAERALETARRVFEEENRARSADERARAMAERVSRRVAETRRPTIDEWCAEQAESSARRLLADLDKADRIFGEAQAADEAETEAGVHGRGHGWHMVRQPDGSTVCRSCSLTAGADVALTSDGAAGHWDAHLRAGMAEAHRWPHPPLDQVAEARRQDEEEAKLAELAELPGTPPASHLRRCAPCRRMAEAKARRRTAEAEVDDHVARLQAEVDAARAAREAKADG